MQGVPDVVNVYNPYAAAAARGWVFGRVSDLISPFAGTPSAPFEPEENGQFAVKVIDGLGSELLMVDKLA